MPKALPAPLQPLLERKSVPLCLLPGSPCWDPALSTQIDRLSSASDALRAALHLLNDDLSRAHTLAQAHEDETLCNLVHCILHRREQDFGNSNWWCRQIDHPLLKLVHGGQSNSEAQDRACSFTDQCQAAIRGTSTVCGAQKLTQLKQLQKDEMVTLVKWILEHDS